MSQPVRKDETENEQSEFIFRLSSARKKRKWLLQRERESYKSFQKYRFHFKYIFFQYLIIKLLLSFFLPQKILFYVPKDVHTKEIKFCLRQKVCGGKKKLSEEKGQEIIICWERSFYKSFEHPYAAAHLKGSFK